MFDIETNIPIPAKRREWSVKYPWHVLDVGQSFFVPDGNFKSMLSLASRAKGRTGKKYLVREVDGGVRVWRTV